MLSAEVMSLLVCPRCKAKLSLQNLDLVCTQCDRAYPIRNRVPILINEDDSIFSIQDCQRQPGKDYHTPWHVKLNRILDQLVPQTTRNIKAKRNYTDLETLLLERAKHPLVLVIGAGTEGAGMSKILLNPAITFIQTDVVLTSTTQIIMDGHDIPFAAETMDGVIIQAVLEHVIDPNRVVSEIHRVLKPRGLVYAETPFMQQVHMGRHDFTRFTHLGHRWLFRHFEEIQSGATCGAGTALAWAVEHFFFSMGVRNRFSRKGITLTVRLLLFGLSYLDKFTIETTGSLDAASSYYFLGTKASKPLSGRELIRQYRGAQTNL